MVECERGTTIELLGRQNRVESTKSTTIVESTERALTGQEAGAQGPQSKSVFLKVGVCALCHNWNAVSVSGLWLNLLKLQFTSLRLSTFRS